MSQPSARIRPPASSYAKAVPPTARNKRLVKVRPDNGDQRADSAALPSAKRLSEGHAAAYRPASTLEQFDFRRAGIGAFARAYRSAPPMEVIQLERQGVQGDFIRELSGSTGLPASRMISILGVPKSTADSKASSGKQLTGRAGQAAIGLVNLIGIAQELVESSTSEAAEGLDAGRWLGRWIETPQPALDGRRPAELLDTPTGVAIVARVLGAIQSGAYQ